MWIDNLPEKARVADTTMAAAYERTGDERRAWFKTSMAMVRSMYDERPEWCELRKCPSGSGFQVTHHKRPVDWVAVLVDEGFQAATRLCSAVMVARAAGAGRVVALLHTPPEPAVLTALELTGVEELFTVDPDLLRLTLLEAAQEPSGRLLLFGPGIARCVPEEARIPLYADRRPRIMLAPDVQEQPELVKRIRETHPDAVFVEQKPDVEYGLTPSTDKNDRALLHLHSDLCGAWIYPHLSPAFFTITRMGMIPVQPQ